MKNVDKAPSDEVDLVDVWKVVWRQRYVFLAGVILPLVVSVGIALKMPKVFVSEASILPLPKAGESSELLAAGMASQVGPVSALLGGFSVEKTPDLIELLSSRAMAVRVLERQAIKNALGGTKSQVEMVDALRDRVSISPSTRAMAILIRVEAFEPQLAADIANAYVDELRAVLDDMAHERAVRSRKLIEGQLLKSKKDLFSAEAKAKRPDSQEEGWLLQQEVSVRRDVYRSLIQQYEASLIAENKGSEGFLSMDRAVPAKAPSDSKTKLLIPIGLLVGLTLGVLAAFASHHLRSAKQ